MTYKFPKMHREARKKIMFGDTDNLYCITPYSISYIDVSDDYLTFHIKKSRFVITMSATTFLEKFEYLRMFFRATDQLVVNKERIVRVDKKNELLILDDKTELKYTECGWENYTALLIKLRPDRQKELKFKTDKPISKSQKPTLTETLVLS